MSLKHILRIAGIVAAVAATITAAVALEKTPQVNPAGALALGVAALALFKGSEVS